MVERDVEVDHTTVYGWVQTYSPVLDKRCRRDLRYTNDSWQVCETYIKVKKRDRYLDRAVDSAGNALNLMLSKTRDAEAAQRFFRQVLNATHTINPRVSPSIRMRLICRLSRR